MPKGQPKRKPRLFNKFLPAEPVLVNTDIGIQAAIIRSHSSIYRDANGKNKKVLYTIQLVTPTRLKGHLMQVSQDTLRKRCAKHKVHWADIWVACGWIPEGINLS